MTTSYVSVFLVLALLALVQAQPVVTDSRCALGTSFYCLSPTEAALCGIDFNTVCASVNASPVPVPTPPGAEIPGAPAPSTPTTDSRCSMGRSFYCLSPTEAALCNVDFATACSNPVPTVVPTPQVPAPFIAPALPGVVPPSVPVDPCTGGASYWCASSRNAASCNVDFATVCSNKNVVVPAPTVVRSTPAAVATPSSTAKTPVTTPTPAAHTSTVVKKTTTTMTASKKAQCAQGRKYWCKSVAAAKSCGINYIKVCKPAATVTTPIRV